MELFLVNGCENIFILSWIMGILDLTALYKLNTQLFTHILHYVYIEIGFQYNIKGVNKDSYQVI